MILEEFKNLKTIKSNKYSKEVEYFLDDDSSFYVEPIFYTQLEGLFRIHPNEKDKILNEIFRVVKLNKKVVFTGDFEAPYIVLDNYIYLEITDITDKLQIFVEDKSRGSDYGD